MAIEEWLVSELTVPHLTQYVPTERPRAGPSAVETLTVGPVSAIVESPLKIRQERTRFVIVGALLVIFAALIGSAIAATFADQRWPVTEKMLGLLLAPVSGLLGTALGFYFRSEQQREDSG